MARLPASKPRAVGSGLVALDVLLESGKKTPKTYAGGSCGNVMAILAWLGWTATPWARLGKDASGRRIVEDLAKHGVDTQFLVGDAGGGSPVIVQENKRTPSGQLTHRFHWKCPSCGNPYPRFRAPLLAGVDAVIKETGHPTVYYFDRATPAGIKLAQDSREHGATVVFEPNSIRDEKLFGRACTVAHVLKYSAERLDAYQDLLEPAKLPVQIETMGPDGLQFRVRQGAWTRLPAFGAPVFVDAAGSGDWCTAALINRTFRKRINWKTIKADAIGQGLARGQALAAINCGYPGARGMMYHLTAREAMAQADALVSKRILSPPAPAAEQPWANWNVCASCDHNAVIPTTKKRSAKT